MHVSKVIISLIFIIIREGKSTSMQKSSYLLDISDPENEITDFIYSKGYLPNEKELPKSSVLKNVDNDVTYLLSKLSDAELIKLLNDQPNKKVYDLNDIVKISLGGKNSNGNRERYDLERNTNDEIGDLSNFNTANKRFRVIPGVDSTQQAYFKLDHKAILHKKQKNEANLMALKKLHSLLNYNPQDEIEDMTEDKKELMFDILVSQLKTLCCKGSKQTDNFANKFVPKTPKQKSYLSNPKSAKIQSSNEFMFLIVNDEIKSKNDDDLILVDPETLEKNSSVLLLGPITTPLTDSQLKIVMDRVGNELSRPEYTSLLKQLSDGTLSDNNVSLMKNFIFGPETRRYIKAHRCNYQSKLAKVYGGPKWLICTGYLNINTPSLYD